MSERFSTEAVALAQLRVYARKYPTMGVSEAINSLDNAGVFTPVDLQTDYTEPEEILEQVTRERHPAGRGLAALDAAEWGDTTRADMARHQRYAENYSTGPESIKPLTPLTEEQARGLFGDTESTDGRF